MNEEDKIFQNTKSIEDSFDTPLLLWDKIQCNNKMDSRVHHSAFASAQAKLKHSRPNHAELEQFSP
jgi:hypothetical protein